MKTIIKLTLAAALTAGTMHASAQDDPLARLKAQRAQELQQVGGQPAGTEPAPADTAPAQAVVAPPMEAPATAPEPMAYTARTSTTLSTNGITFNFRNAPLESVLTYMSDAA